MVYPKESTPPPASFLPNRDTMPLELVPTGSLSKSPATTNQLDSKERLAAISKMEILDRPVERNFQMLVELANSLLDTPVSLISIVTDDRQFFVSADGLVEPWLSRRETPLSHSFCQFVVTRDAPLVVSNAREDPLVCENLAIDDIGVGAYLGVPLRTDDNLVLGSFCVIDSTPRQWSQQDQLIVDKLAKLAVSELETRIDRHRQQTEFERRLRHAQKMEAIGQFTAGIVHDFNNVLATIQIYGDLLKEELGNQKIPQNYVKEISKTISSATETVQQLLTWSRPAQEEMRFFELQVVVEDLLPMLQTSLPNNVQIEFRNRHKCVVQTKPGLIHQILANLCSNAEYAMRPNGGRMTIEIKEKFFEVPEVCKCGRYAQLSFSDTGNGIPPEILERVQDPYFTTKPIGIGTGLGLWTVYGIVHELGGEIQIDSKVGTGTTFDIYLPCVPHPINTSIQNEPMGHAEITTKTRILIVDDNESIAHGMKQQLRLKGYDAECTIDSRHALQLISECPTRFELLIADQKMPHFAGDLLAKKTKSINPNIHVILCSGNIPNDKHPLGVDVYCCKPISLTNLVANIESVLSSPTSAGSPDWRVG